MLRYRPDIDGLRGLAILLVLLFHFQIPGFGGGFVGVDVFFVISGFLITRIVMDEISSGTFTFRDFYYRRARRLLPALSIVSVGVVLLSILIIAPLELRALGRDVVATQLFSSNLIFYWLTPSYFEASTEFNPLLMTWSLGIEEQFYLVWPAFLILLSRVGKVSRVLTVLAAASFATSIGLTVLEPKAAFFLLPSRFWELAVGGLVAEFLRHREPAAKGSRDRLLFALGALLIVGGAMLLAKDALFPGPAAAIPVVGTVLLIVFGGMSGDASKNPLASPVLVGLGKISYSLYLWHWPILTFARWLNGEQRPLSIEWRLFCAVLALLVAYASWKWVEMPFRNPKTTPRRLLGVVLATSGFACVVGVIVFVTWGFPQRYTSAQLAAIRDTNVLLPECTHASDATTVDSRVLEACTFGKAHQRKAVVYGDSHADALFPGLADFFASRGMATVQLAQTGCSPLIGDGSGGDPVCQRNHDFVTTEPFRMLDADVVAIAGYWGGFNRREQIEAFKASLARTLKILSASTRRIIVFGDVPAFPFRVAVCQTKAMLSGFFYRLQFGDQCGMPKAKVAESFEHTNEVVRLVASKFPKTCYVSLATQICDDEWCHTKVGDQILYVDHDHLSATGARVLVRNSDVAKCFETDVPEGPSTP